jgi:hypothetical protein
MKYLHRRCIEGVNSKCRVHGTQPQGPRSEKNQSSIYKLHLDSIFIRKSANISAGSQNRFSAIPKMAMYLPLVQLMALLDLFMKMRCLLKLRHLCLSPSAFISESLRKYNCHIMYYHCKSEVELTLVTVWNENCTQIFIPKTVYGEKWLVSNCLKSGYFNFHIQIDKVECNSYFIDVNKVECNSYYTDWRYFEKISKSDITHPKVVPPGSLSQSNYNWRRYYNGC